MAMYNDTVMDHFTNPRNVGEIENADGTGAFDSPVCGDTTHIYIKVENDTITDIRFKTLGCGAAIASSSMATEIIKGKTIDEALSLTGEKIVDELGGLPAVKTHCSVLADRALKAAIYDYATKNDKTYAGLAGYDPDAPFDEEDEHEECVK